MREDAYPIDLSRAQFEVIRPLLECIRKKTKPREVDWFEVGCALLTVLRGGNSVEEVAQGFSKVEHGQFVLCTVEESGQATSQRMGAGAEATG